MDGVSIVFLLKVVFENFPKGFEVVALLNDDVVILASVDAVFAIAAPFQSVPKVDGRRKIALNDLCIANAEEGIQVFFCRHLVVDVRNRFVDNFPETVLCKEHIQFSEQLLYFFGGGFVVEN